MRIEKIVLNFGKEMVASWKKASGESLLKVRPVKFDASELRYVQGDTVEILHEGGLDSIKPTREFFESALKRGKKFCEMAEELNCTYSNVIYHLKKYGLYVPVKAVRSSSVKK